MDSCYGYVIKAQKIQVLTQAIKQLGQAVDMALSLVVCDKESKQELISIQSMVKSQRINKVVLPMWINKAQKVIRKEMNRAMWDGKKGDQVSQLSESYLH